MRGTARAAKSQVRGRGARPARERVEISILPKTCHLAADSGRPRWRFLLVFINRTKKHLRLREIQIAQVSGRARVLREVRGDDLSEMLVQGSLEIPPPGAVILDIREPSDTNTAPRSVHVGLRTAGAPGPERRLRRRVLLKRTRTRSLRFPLDGPWIAANARADLHCLGSAFGFDFIHAADMRHHDRPPKRRMRLGEFASVGATIRAPSAGEVIAAEANQPDFPPTLTSVTFPEVPPEGEGRMALLGNYVVLRTKAGDCIFLCHMKRGSLRVRAGQRVAAGAILGEVGNSGNTSGPHLHIEVLDGAPDFPSLFTMRFAQSGVPFGFRGVRIRGRAGKVGPRGTTVPSKRDVVSRVR